MGQITGKYDLLYIKSRIKTAPNGRFGAMAALAPQKRQCELGSYYPAATLVKPPLRQAAGTLCKIRRTV